MQEHHKISFIVIGRNQEKTILSCINSIFNSIDVLGIDEYEIIYVDSKSNDSTINILTSNFNNKIIVILLTGYINASIGRNVGASYATGNVYFFIDGDMVINPEFLRQVFDSEKGLKYNFVSGKLKEHLYNDKFEKVGVREDRYNIVKDVEQTTVGGVFIIKAHIFNGISGFRNHLRINEDLDFGLRLALKGIFLKRIPVFIAEHHTVEFYHFSRIFHRLIKGDQLYSGLIFKYHLTNRFYYKMFLKQEKFTILLLLVIGLAIKISPLFLTLYPFFVLIKHIRSPVNSYWEMLLGRLIDNIIFVVGVIFFYKKNVHPSFIKYERIM